MIAYKEVSTVHTAVLIDGKTVGHIHQSRFGFTYKPLGHKHGEYFGTFAACQASLEQV